MSIFHDLASPQQYPAIHLAGRYQQAIVFGRKAVQQRVGFSGAHRIYAASLAEAGQIEDARAALKQLKMLQPEISLAWTQENSPYRREPMAKIIAGLSKAGLE